MIALGSPSLPVRFGPLTMALTVAWPFASALAFGRCPDARHEEPWHGRRCLFQLKGLVLAQRQSPSGLAWQLHQPDPPNPPLLEGGSQPAIRPLPDPG
jgi:hypothetical protein